MKRNLGKNAKVALFGLLANVAIFGVAHAQSQGTLDKVKETGSITIGNRESSVPFSYLDGNQKPVGYSIDLCHKVVDAIKAELKLSKLEVKYVPVTSQNRIPLVQNGTVDLECGSTTHKLDRAKQVTFSNTTFVANVKMAVKTDSGVSDIDDLNGKPVVTTTGTTSDALIKKHERGAKIDIKNIYGKDHADSFLMLDSGRAVAFIMDDILLAGLIANAKEPKQFKIIEPSLQKEPYGIMFRKDDASLKALVDKTLVGLMKSGEINNIYSKWFMKPIPPKNINLNFPQSAETKAVFSSPNDKGIE